VILGSVEIALAEERTPRQETLLREISHAATRATELRGSCSRSRGGSRTRRRRSTSTR
jgi:hypothetical protein